MDSRTTKSKEAR